MIKLLAIAITLMVSYPWLSGVLLNYTRQIMLRIGEQRLNGTTVNEWLLLHWLWLCLRPLSLYYFPIKSGKV